MGGGEYRPANAIASVGCSGSPPGPNSALMASSGDDGSFVSGSEYEAMGCRSSAGAASILVISAPSVRDGSFVSSAMLSAAFRSDCCGSPAIANSILVISVGLKGVLPLSLV